MKVSSYSSRFWSLAMLIAFSASCLFAQPSENKLNKTSSNPENKAKYVFYYIGDGMGLAHVSITEAYKATKKGKIGSEPLLFTQFPYLGLQTNYSASNIITCSSASGTALASGYKTKNAMVGMKPDSTNVHQISYKLKELGYRIGIMSTVTLDNATPACFYAHNISRKNYYEISMELPQSGFDFFGGGGFEGASSKKVENPKKDIYEQIDRYGYTVAYGTADYKAKKDFGVTNKMILLQPDKENADKILPFAYERKESDLTLAQLVESAIDFLYEPDGKGFFMMAEGGKIDWSAHSNDVAGVIFETLDFDDAIKVAYDFYTQHPDETLIVITADHETGGLGLGRKGYVYDLSRIDELVEPLRKGKITLNDFIKKDNLAKIDSITRIGWTTKSHTGIHIPIYAIGAGSELFAGRMNNTDIPLKIMKAMGATARFTDHYYSRVDKFAKEAPINSNDIVFLGNSLTEGGKWDTYFPAVNKKLAKKGGAIRNRGIVGDTFIGIDNRLDEVTKGHPAKIFLLTGANDISHNLTSEEIAEGIFNLVKRIQKESPKTKIYLQSVFPFNESFKRYRLLNGKTHMVSEINALLEKGAKELKVTFINLYPLLLTNGEKDLVLPPSEQVLNPNITRDGLHLTADGYKIWSAAIEKYVKQ